MNTVIPFVVGALVAVGVALLLQRSLGKTVIGLAILSNAVNLIIFYAGGLSQGKSPVIPEGETVLAPPYADPLTQALILTAIVIGFAVLAYAVVLAFRTYQASGEDDVDALRDDRA